jgi:prepilin peptidase CpaA
MLVILILTVVPALVAYAAASDLLTMTIPNRLCLALAALFPPLALMAGMDLETIGFHVLAGFAVLSVTFGFFAAGWIGGGDAKFAAACAIWMGFEHLVFFLMISSLLGGALTLGILWMKANPMPVLAYHMPWYARLQDKTTGIPYGIALSFAGLGMLPQTSIWAAVFVL